MKYMVINTMGESFTTISPEERMKIIDGSSRFIEKYRKLGKLKERYVVPSLKKNVSIFEVESPEEIDRLFMENPASPYENSELYLLADWDNHEKNAKEVFGNQ